MNRSFEHEVHHRSQIDTYAGLQGWAVPDIFGRSAETIAVLQPAQQVRHGGPGREEPGQAGM